jgi:hypothetical protein
MWLRARLRSTAEPDSKAAGLEKSNSLSADGVDQLQGLKSSVSSYFGAQSRIVRGEEFIARARRLGPEGDVQG